MINATETVTKNAIFRLVTSSYMKSKIAYISPKNADANITIPKKTSPSPIFFSSIKCARTSPKSVRVDEKNIKNPPYNRPEKLPYIF